MLPGPFHMYRMSSTYLRQKATCGRRWWPDLKMPLSSLFMNNSEIIEPNGDPIGIPMSGGKVKKELPMILKLN